MLIVLARAHPAVLRRAVVKSLCAVAIREELFLTAPPPAAIADW
jgi:hypothetical protein